MSGAIAQRIAETPVPDGSPRVDEEMAALLRQAADEPRLAALSQALGREDVRRLLAGTFSGSAYLQGLALRDLDRLQRVLTTDPDAHCAALVAEVAEVMAAAPAIADAMRILRQFKAEMALLTGLADLAGVWPVMRVTAALSEAADTACATAVRFLFRLAATKGDWRPDDAARPEVGGGYFVLAMGKHGARELNYSSDIDLIVFFEADRARLRDGLEAQTFFVRLTRDLVRLLQERTGDGYVFRTDLRLRPDPGATQVALSTEAALHYYESFGQNWERAALIKARCVRWRHRGR